MITIIEEPNRVSAANLPMNITINDDNETTLFYRVTIYGNDNIVLGRLKLFKRGTDNTIDISRILSNYVKTEINNSNNLFESLEGGVRYNISVLSYRNDGVVNDTYYSESKIAYNAGVNYLKFDVTDWYMDFSNITNKYSNFLTSKPEVTKIFKFQKEYLYFLADDLSGVNRFRITFYDYNNNILHTHNEALSITNKIIHRFNLQPSNVLAINPAALNVHKYTIALYHNSDRVSKERTYIIDKSFDCNEPVCINWENFEGGVDSFTFINPRETKASNKQLIQRGYIEYSNGRYSPYNSIISNSLESTYKLTSLGISDEEFKSLTNIIGSLNTYVWINNTDILPIIITTSSAQVKRKKYNGLLRFTLEFKSKPDLDLIIKYLD